MLVEPRLSADAPAPDGGFVAWVQCASSFSLFFLSWGIVSSFGAFQTYYETTHPSWSLSQVSWIGSTQAFLLFGFAIVAGPVFDHGYLRPLVWTGCFFCVLEMMLTSISSEYWHLILAQGVMFGLGSGCLFIPSIAVLPAYFDKKQALALGIGASGSAVVFMGAYIPPFYIQSYALDTNIVKGDLASYLLPLLNVGSFFGCIIPTHFADIYGPFNIDTICVLLSGILAFTWISIQSTPSMILFSIFYGFFAGALTPLSPNLAVALSPDMGVLGVRLGMVLIPTSVGILVGNPIAGALESYGWTSLQTFTAALLMASFVVIAFVRILMYGKSLKVRC
ncbi:hypothetical protein OCU04_003721 [Sclerotinia nivalis]|uniref:Major facilitator superfamily (MFS) profile domain-containing protein n=1 Tax=Sclerotinia nivalis TaxID=352851 RepID=A0A9X0ASJ4_9HELO|nr:hypothetical protein OCU04_003721 [Sclerotinia nivalis]